MRIEPAEESRKSDCSRVSPITVESESPLSKVRSTKEMTTLHGRGAGRESRKQVVLHMLSLKASKSFEQS